MKKILWLFYTLLILFSLSSVSANFACGKVIDSESFASDWMSVSVYYSENPLDVVNCQVSPENKFCCDLDEIKTVSWEVGKEINAEIYEPDLEYIAGPVKMIITGEGYDLFPDMKIEKPIEVNSELKKILINKDNILLNVSLANNYNNLKYILNSSGPNIEETVCENCTSASLNVPLQIGENTLTLIAYGANNFSKRIDFFNLEYLKIEHEFVCDECNERDERIYVPSDKEIKLKVKINSSHEIDGELLNYFPKEWFFENLSFEDFSPSHNLVHSSLGKDSYFEIIYGLKSPKLWWTKNYNFLSEIENQSVSSSVFVFSWRKYPWFLSFHKKYSKHHYNFENPSQISSNANPIVIKKSSTNLDYLSIHPKENIKNAKTSLIVKKSFIRKKQDFTLISNIPKNKIEKVEVSFKIEKWKKSKFYLDGKRIYPELTKEDHIYKYYVFDLEGNNHFSVVVY